MEGESRDIKIPIKDIVSNAMQRNGARYEEDEFNLLRKYFIACLNLGFLKPGDLVEMVNKFAYKIKLISLNYNNINKMDYYMINNGILYIKGDLKFQNPMFYEINFYKAVSEVVFNANDVHIGISNALCNIAAEKIYNMDVNESRIIMPKTDEEKIGEKTIKVRTGYYNYNLTISLLKQLFISLNINENRIIHDMFMEGYNEVFNKNFKDSNTLLLIDVLDKLTMMYISRKVSNMINPSEFTLLEKYQIIVNDAFTSIDQNYLAFCALITTDELRERCMKNKQG